MYPNYGQLIETLESVHGELSPQVKALAFMAYSLGGADMLKYSQAHAAEFKDLGMLFGELTNAPTKGLT